MQPEITKKPNNKGVITNSHLNKFAKQAHFPSLEIVNQYKILANEKPEAYWGELSKALLFDKKHDSVLKWNCPRATWFEGAKLNVSKNCLDRHVASEKVNKPAIIWEGEGVDSNGDPTEKRILSYKELLALTCQIANTLKDIGVKKGDRVALYMPMVPECVASMQACARIGAIHTVVFAGFSANSISDRLIDCQAKFVITADFGLRKNKVLKLKSAVDQAVEIAKSKNHNVEKVLVYQRFYNSKNVEYKSIKEEYFPERDILWSESVLKAGEECNPVSMDSEDPLFILYTSGTTGKPKGLYHTQAGYLLWAHWSTRWVFDLKEQDIFWCTADCGWITGHTYVSYGPLSNGATQFIYEGAPMCPDESRFWRMIESHKITTFYTAPTAIRSFMKFGSTPIKKHDLSSLKLLGSVGEPINPEAWHWYFETIGNDKCPIVDTWWQTETGGIMISPLPGAGRMKAGCATQSLPGIEVKVVDPKTGVELNANQKGALIIDKPWPSMARGIWGDEERFAKTYWNTSNSLSGKYLTGDFAIKDDQEDIWIAGRMDDVLNIAGHRLGTAEVESALILHNKVNEAAAIGIPCEIKGEALVCFVSLVVNFEADEKLKQELKQFVASEIGAHARPEQIRFVQGLPKTRSGKIMRRLLREKAIKGEISGDVSTLEDFDLKALDEKTL